jgi:hypothetical protein
MSRATRGRTRASPPWPSNGGRWLRAGAGSSAAAEARAGVEPGGSVLTASPNRGSRCRPGPARYPRRAVPCREMSGREIGSMDRRAPFIVAAAGARESGTGRSSFTACSSCPARPVPRLDCPTTPWTSRGARCASDPERRPSRARSRARGTVWSCESRRRTGTRVRSMPGEDCGEARWCELEAAESPALGESIPSRMSLETGPKHPSPWERAVAPLTRQVGRPDRARPRRLARGRREALLPRPDDLLQLRVGLWAHESAGLSAKGL